MTTATILTSLSRPSLLRSGLRRFKGVAKVLQTERASRVVLPPHLLGHNRALVSTSAALSNKHVVKQDGASNNVPQTSFAKKSCLGQMYRPSQSPGFVGRTYSSFW